MLILQILVGLAVVEMAAFFYMDRKGKKRHPKYYKQYQEQELSEIGIDDLIN